MAQPTTNADKNADKNPEAGVAAPTAAPAADPAAAQRQHLVIDDSSVSATYANFCRFTPLPEELALDFGLNMQPIGAAPHSVKVTQRVVLSYHSAKRLSGLLQAVLQRHEATFGPLELDIQKRALPGMVRPQS